MDGFILRYLLIKLIRIFNRAVFDTGCATCAFALYDISGFFKQRYPEASLFPFNTVNFSIAQDFDVWMPADLDQFGREYSDGALIGGEGLIQLGHLAANGGAFVNQINFKARIAKVERGLNTADSPTDNHHIAKTSCREAFTKLFKLFFFHLLYPVGELHE